MKKREFLLSSLNFYSFREYKGRPKQEERVHHIKGFQSFDEIKPISNPVTLKRDELPSCFNGGAAHPAVGTIGEFPSIMNSGGKDPSKWKYHIAVSGRYHIKNGWAASLKLRTKAI